MIIAVPPKTLNADQKCKLTKKGYVVIEIEDPDKVRIVVAEQPIATNDLLMATLHALAGSSSDTNARRFTDELYKRLKESE